MFWNDWELWREMIHDVNRLDYRGWPTDYGRRPRYIGRWPKILFPEIRHVKSCDPCDPGSVTQRHLRWHILVIWDLFFGACHFCSFETVDLATFLVKRNQNLLIFGFLTLLCMFFLLLSNWKHLKFHSFWLCCQIMSQITPFFGPILCRKSRCLGDTFQP